MVQVPEPSRIDRVTIRAELEPESSDRLKQAHQVALRVVDVNAPQTGAGDLVATSEIVFSRR